jgi:hypothetical protein
MGNLSGDGSYEVASVMRTTNNTSNRNNNNNVQEQPYCSFGQKYPEAPYRRSNFWISGDLLILTVCEGGFSCQFGDTTINTTIVNSTPTTSIAERDQDIDFHWGLGYRAGMGVDWPCSGWDVAAYWTHFNGKGNGHSHHNHAHWWLHFNVADAVLGRKFWVGSTVYLRPFTGMRYAQIKQGLRTHLESNIIAATGTSVVVSRMKDKEKLWALGPELGLEADIYFAHRWSVYGSLTGAILYGHTKTIFVDTDTFALANNICHATASSCATQTVLDIAFGVRWEWRHFTFQAGLEDHTYFDYNHIGCSGNLNLFGGNVSVGVHF